MRTCNYIYRKTTTTYSNPMFTKYFGAMDEFEIAETKSFQSLLFLINFIANRYFSPECVLQFGANDEFIQFDNVTTIIVSSNRVFDVSHFRYYDVCKEIFVYKSHNPRQTFENFENFIRKDSRKKFPKRKYLFYIDSNQIGHFDELFDSPGLEFVTNLIVIIKDNRTDDQFHLYTHKYVGQTDNNQALLLDTWHVANNSFTFGNNLYPDKISNQQGRLIVVYAGTVYPQTYIGIIE